MYFKFLKVTIVSFLLAVGANSIMAQETLTFTEGQTITAGQEFHTSSNMSVIIGLGEIWEAKPNLLGDGVYYCHAKGNPNQGDPDNGGTSNVGLNTLPDRKSTRLNSSHQI